MTPASRVSERGKPLANSDIRAARRAADLFRTFGLTGEMYDAIRCYQIGLCAYCGRPLLASWGAKGTAVDHDELDGVIRVRGIVHNTCNRDLGAIDRLIARYGFERGCPDAMRWYFTDPPAQRALVALADLRPR